MAALLAKMKESYNYVAYDLCDPRTRDSFPSPELLCCIIPLYVYFSNSLGPRLMKDVKPFKLKNTILIYNIFQIFINAYIFYEGSVAAWMTEYSWTCQPVDMTDSPTAKRIINGVWWYTVIKVIDFLDTVFFVLRKKDRQISFLHVFHHAVMLFASYVGLKYYPNGQGTLLGVINCFIHVIMYSYYLISGLGPEYQKYLWWKKHLTTMQLVQFGIIFIHGLVNLFTECNYPKWITALICIHSLHFVYLFGKFYYENYIKNAKKESKNGSVKTVTENSKVK